MLSRYANIYILLYFTSDAVLVRRSMQTQRQYSGTWQPEASPLHTNLIRLARAPIAYLPFAGKPFRDKKPTLLLFPYE